MKLYIISCFIILCDGLLCKSGNYLSTKDIVCNHTYCFNKITYIGSRRIVIFGCGECIPDVNKVSVCIICNTDLCNIDKRISSKIQTFL